jgi:hypothetical protein
MCFYFKFLNWKAANKIKQKAIFISRLEVTKSSRISGNFKQAIITKAISCRLTNLPNIGAKLYVIFTAFGAGIIVRIGVGF